MKTRRVYIKDGRYYYVQDLPERNPKTGRPKQKWHPLTRASEGAAALYTALAAFLTPEQQSGNIKKAIAEFLDTKLPELTPDVRKEYERMFDKIGEGFERFDVDQVIPADILKFLKDNFSDTPTARGHYKARLSTFFSWAVINQYCRVNPCREIKLKAPPKRKLKVDADGYHAIRDALSNIGQCFLDLMFLTLQRPTEIRLLKESKIRDGKIDFTPSKTERTSGASVTVPISPEIQAVLDRARSLAKIKALRGGDAFVIQSKDGSGYTKTGMNSLWRRACKKAKVTGVTTRDIRPFALTEAERMGYRIEELRKAAAHTTVTTTEGYLSQYRQVISPVHLFLPERKKD